MKIGALFKIERAHADAPRKQREAVRRLKSKPIVDDFFAWCEAEPSACSTSRPSRRRSAMPSTRSRAAALPRRRRLPLHNNISELNLRREVVGRKNWLFVGSEDGAKANTDFVSLIASCRMLGLEPCAYLRDLLCLLAELAQAPAARARARVLEQRPSSSSDAQQRLDANVFRRVALGLLVLRRASPRHRTRVLRRRECQVSNGADRTDTVYRAALPRRVFGPCALRIRRAI